MNKIIIKIFFLNFKSKWFLIVFGFLLFVIQESFVEKNVNVCNYGKKL